MINNFSKIALIVGLIACFSINVFAQDEQGQLPPQNNADQKAKVQRLIRKGVESNKEEIQKEALYLSLSDKEYLYEKNIKKDAVGWAALDFFVGFGIGSYIQGDVEYGVQQSIMDALGWVLIVIGMAADGDGGKIGALGAGTIILVVNRIQGLIYPFSYQKRYNRTLDEVLNGDKVSYSIDPLLIPKERVPATGLAFNLHF